MKFNIQVVENEIRACHFFKDHSYVIDGIEHESSGELESYIITLTNDMADRSIEIALSPYINSDKPAVWSVDLVKTSAGTGFDLQDYLKQHHALTLDESKFLIPKASGGLDEHARSFLYYITNLIEKNALDVINGTEWPHVEFDWSGLK